MCNFEGQRTKTVSKKLTAMKHIGKLIIVLTSIASLNPYLLIFTIPAFSLGAIFIWISNLKTKAKALWTILPVLLWYPSFSLFMVLSGIIGAATSQKLDFIFPINFEGKAIVIENMPCGQPVRVLNGREQLFVPESGVLLYQSELKGGMSIIGITEFTRMGKKLNFLKERSICISMTKSTSQTPKY